MTYPIKIEFKEYPSGSWTDWSQYLNSNPVINTHVESDNEGEAGIIVFDSASVSFKNESGNPVYTKFQNNNLTTAERYLFRISAPKSDKTYVQLFEGIADFSMIEGEDNDPIINFDIVDKLSALGILNSDLSRTTSTLNSRVLAQVADADALTYTVQDVTAVAIRVSSGGNDRDLTSPIFNVGELLVDPESVENGSPEYYVVVQSYIYDMDGVQTNRVELDRAWAPSLPFTYDLSTNYCKYLSKEIYSVDCNNIGSNANGDLLLSLDGIKILEALYNQAWSSYTLVKKPSSLSFSVPLEYALRFINENPFDGNPLDAMKKVTDSMQCYVRIDSDGNLVIQEKSSLDSNGTTRSIGSTLKFKNPKRKFFWDKLSEGVDVKLDSWIKDPTSGEYLEGESLQTKEISPGSGVYVSKPKNQINKSLLTTDSSDNTIELLNSRAATLANSILNFYGKRHQKYTFFLRLDDNTINWELLDNLTYNSVAYFFTSLEFDLAARRVTIEAVEIEGHDYDLRGIVVSLSESSSVGISSGGGAGGGAGTYNISVDATFTPPLYNDLGVVSLHISDNLQVLAGTTNILDTIQDIKTTSTPQFAKIGIGKAADASYPLAILGNGWITGNLKIDTGISIGQAADPSHSFALTGNGKITGKLGIGQAVDATYKLGVTGGIKLTSGNIALNGNWLSGDGANEGIYVDSAGKVGVAISSPLYPLNVYSSAQTQIVANGYSSINNVASISSGEVGVGTIGGVPAAIFSYKNGDGGLYIRNEYSSTSETRGFIDFSTNNSGSIVDAMRITPSGKVGIGYNIPSEKLTIAGNLAFSSLSSYNITTNTGHIIINPSNGHLKFEPTGTDPNVLLGNAWLKREGYVSQTTGWAISPLGEADFRYLYVDELHAKAFIADLEQALAGGQIISKSVAKIASDFTAPAAGGYAQLIVESFAGFDTVAVFQNGDYVRLRQFDRSGGGLDISDCWGTVSLDTSYGTNGFLPADSTHSISTQAYTFFRLASNSGHISTGGTVKSGTLALDYGISGNGYIESNAIDGLNGANSPYTQIVTWETQPKNLMVHVRTGNLRGITGISGEYGIMMGGITGQPDPSDPNNDGAFIYAFTNNDSYIRASNQAFQIHNMPFDIYNGTNTICEIDISGNMKLGTDVGDNLSTSFDFAASTGRLRVGFEGVNKANLYFDGANLNLRVNTSNRIVLNPISDSILIGQEAAGQSNVLISSGQIKLRNNTTDKIVLDTDGTGYFHGDITSDAIITGGTIRTSASYPRITMESSSNSIRFYNSSSSYLVMTPYEDTSLPYISLGSGGIYSSRTIGSDTWTARFIYGGLYLNKNSYPSISLSDGNIATTDGSSSTLIRANGSIGGAQNLTFDPSGDIYLDPAGDDILPGSAYSKNLGALSNKYLTLHAAELWVETLVAQQTVATIGGRIIVAPTTSLNIDVHVGDTFINVKYNNLNNGDIIYLEANGSLEFMQVISDMYIIDGRYRYNVTRNIDGSGQNGWWAGDAVVNLGQAGSGFIDIYSVRGVKSSSQEGPSIVGNIRNSSTYNDWSEGWAIGNLNGIYGYGSNIYGAAFGKYANGNSFITIEPTNGIRMMKRASSSSATMFWLKADGSGQLANGDISWDDYGNVSIAGNVIVDGTISGSIISAKTITADQIASGTITSSLIAAGTIVASNIHSGTITGSLIAAGTITGSLIAAGTITSTLIAAGTIVGSNISAGTITAGLLNVTTLSSITANIGTITAGNISGITITGSTITGSTIRTSSINPKVELDASTNRLNFYSSSGDISFITNNTASRLIDIRNVRQFNLYGNVNGTSTQNFEIDFDNMALSFTDYSSGLKLFTGTFSGPDFWFINGSAILKLKDGTPAIIESAVSFTCSGNYLKGSKYFQMSDYDSGGGEVSIINRDTNWMFWGGGVAIGQWADGALGALGNGNLRVQNNIQAGGYKSSDGSAGITDFIDVSVGTTITIKNGLITAYS